MILKRKLVDNSFRKYFLSVFSIATYISSNAQLANNDSTYYNDYDKIVGIENTGLYQGVIYEEKYRTINSYTQFFRENKFLNGSVNYNGQHFYNLKLKFDVYEGNLLLRLKNSVGGGTLRLIKKYVESFTIDGHHFVKLEKEEINNNLTSYGFYEDAYNGPYFDFYVKPIKKSFERTNRNAVYFEFKDGKNEYVLKYNNEYQVVTSKRDFVNLFPSLKKEINEFYNLARDLRNSNLDKFHLSLLRRIEILLAQEISK